MLHRITDDQIADLALALRGQEHRTFFLDLARKYFGPSVERVDITISVHWNDEGFVPGLGGETHSGIVVYDLGGNELPPLEEDGVYEMQNEIPKARYPIHKPFGAYGDDEPQTTTYYASDPFKSAHFKGVNAQGLQLYAQYPIDDYVTQDWTVQANGGVAQQTFITGPKGFVEQVLEAQASQDSYLQEVLNIAYQIYTASKFRSN